MFFWDKETLSEEDRTYLSKIYTEFSEEIKIITLNHGDEPKQVRITLLLRQDRVACGSIVIVR